MPEEAAVATPETPAPPEDNSNGGAPQDPGLLANPPSDAENPPASTPPAGEPTQTDGIPVTPGEKPAHIAEQFWDADKGAVKVDVLGESYNSLRNEMNKLRQEKGEPNGKPLENAEDFLKDWTPPHRSSPREGQKEGDELNKFGDLQPDDPVFVAMSQAAKNSNMSKGQFDDFMQGAMEHLHPLLKDPFNPQKELESLGEGGEKMVQVNSTWIERLQRNGILNEDQHRLMLSFGATALGVEVVNALRLNSGEKPIPVNASVNTGVKTQAEAQAMLNDDRYRQDGPVGDAYRAEVDKAFAETFGTEKV